MREIQFREALREAMVEEMRKDDRIFLMGEEVAEYNGAYKVSLGMLEEFGAERVIDTPIAETGFSGIGVGSAMNGLRPIVEFMTFNFSLVAIDQIINGAAKMYQMSGGQFNIPIVFRGPTGNAGQLGAQHSQNFENWYANTPGLKVVIPSNPYDALGLLRTSRKDNNPVIFAEHSLLYRVRGEVPDDYYEIPFGKANIVRPGTDVTIVSYSGMVRIAEEAAKTLEEKGISAEIIDLRTLSPLDMDTVIESVRKTNRAAVIEETWKTGGFSGTIASEIQEVAFDDLDGPVLRINAPDVPAPYARNIEQAMIPSADWLVDSITYNFGL